MPKLNASIALIVVSLALPAAAVAGSQPTSTRASNIAPGDTRSEVAPSLPEPPVAPDSPPEAYLAAARTSLMHGQTGQAQEALEMAETRLLDRSIAPDTIGTPVSDGMVVTIANARQALGNGKPDQAIQILDGAVAH